MSTQLMSSKIKSTRLFNGFARCDLIYQSCTGSQDCVGYQPPGGATVFGDPHVYTFDNMQYTFNGKGEFVLVRADSPRVKLDVQGRFEQVQDSPYGEVLATTLTAVAAKDNVSSTVEVTCSRLVRAHHQHVPQ